jgi:RNA polymerase sigma-70 factor (ECF subfamily)
MDPTGPDRELVRAVLEQGDVKAFEALVRRYQRPLYGFIRRQVGAKDGADDLFQQTVFRLYDRLSSCENPDGFRAWAFGVAANVCRYEGRSQLVRRTFESKHARGTWTGPPTPEESAQALQLRRRLEQVISELPAVQREVFVLYSFTRLQYDEIATALGIPVGTVKSRMNSALQQLRGQLAGLEGSAS